jgi:ubiquinone/menaquinone biosynthesis C-methylase UbiE
MSENMATDASTPAAMVRRHMGESSDLEIIDRLLQVKGFNLVDVGCGAGANSRALATRGATVLGVEPDPIQAEKNRAADPTPNLTFAEARAESLPVESNSVDGVFFFRSLHHVPLPHMDDAIVEAARVLRAGSGVLWVIEPAMTGTHFPVMRTFNDETEVREAAQAALARTARQLFESEEDYEFVRYPSYQNFEALVARATGHTYTDFSREHVLRDEVREQFEAGRTDDGNYVFDQPMLLNLYRDAKATT